MEEGVQIGNLSIPIAKGEKGDKGDTGSAATITVGSVTTGAAGTSASVTNSGTTSAAVLDFTIPKGDTGTTDYLELDNIPTINGVQVTGQLTSSDLSLQGELTAGSNITISSGTISATDTTYSDATTSVHGLMSTTDKSKLDGIASGSQVNVIETIKVNGTAQTVTSKAVDITMPTKVSDLSNDSGFITSSALTGYVTNTDYATSSTGGVVKISDGYGLELSNVGALRGKTQTYSNYQSMNNAGVICKGTLENVLSNVVGDINTALDTINGEVI